MLQAAIQSYTECRATEAATSIAYFALFSLFPLLLFIVAGASFILEREYAQQQLIQYIRAIIPVSQSVIVNNINRILEERSTFGLVALVGFLWSASGVFTTLAVNINRAWSEANARTVLQARLIALGMVAVLVGLLFLSLLITTVLNLLAEARLPIFGIVGLYESIPWRILYGFLPFLIRLALFYGLYLWVPTTRVRWRAAFWGALVAALMWELITRAFILFLASRFARYELVYGSLGTIVALMFWIYLSSSATLFGAHLTASLMKPEKRTPEEDISTVIEVEEMERV